MRPLKSTWPISVKTINIEKNLSHFEQVNYDLKGGFYCVRDYLLVWSYFATNEQVGC